MGKSKALINIMNYYHCTTPCTGYKCEYFFSSRSTSFFEFYNLG